MEEAKHPLLRIAELAGTDLDSASDFCSAVQALCHTSPSHAAIAQAVKELGRRSLL